MTRHNSLSGPVVRDASARAAVAALVASVLWMLAACSSAEILSGGEGGTGGGRPPNGGGGASGAGGPSGGGGFLVKLDAAPRADAAPDRRSGGTCGDGVIERSEQCDDGNAENGDGCSRICQIEANWDCPEEGKACVYVGNCGSGHLTSNKVCDDGNTKSGDGCSSDCKTVETGYICRVPGRPCTTRCGDGLVKGFETCDDGNTAGGDGCSASCKVEAGYDCTGSPSACKKTVCGNKVTETGETCDDGNTLPYDGCASNCQKEPVCGTSTSAVGACKSTCGDGILWPGMEECDDGNAADGDGCSKDCKIESGWTCKSTFDDPPPKLQIPIIARDFQNYSPNSTPPTGHPDFGHYCCDDSLQKGKGVVRSTLDSSHKPVWAGPTQDPLADADAQQLLFTGKKEFDQWYRDVSGVNMTVYESLTLLQSATAKTTYAMNSDTDQPWLDLCGFFPLDDLSKPKVDQNTGKPVTYTETRKDPTTGKDVTFTCHAYDGLGFGSDWANHNFSFTTELRYWFQYQGTEKLKFTGDDDVWVFINGTMAIEMPGIHNRAVGTVILDSSNGTAQVGYGEPPSSYSTVDLKMTKGSVYEVVVFQAERWCCGSNYMLTLANFIGGKTQCVPTCGDGVAVADEECDCGDGSGALPAGCPGPNDEKTYGGCTKQCKWGPFCGDGTTQSPPSGPEECDKGKDNGNGTSECSIACKAPRTCGDAKVDTDLEEECDFGGNNGVTLNGELEPDPNGQVFCTNDCKIPPGIVY
jgi:fibro-slime domain-containing protein